MNYLYSEYLLEAVVVYKGIITTIIMIIIIIIIIIMCKKFNFDQTNKWYMHNPAPVPENNTHKLQWDFDIYTDHRVSARRPDLIIINNNNNNNNKKKKDKLQNCRLCCPGWPQNKTERTWKEGQIPQPCLGIEKTEEHAGDNYTNCNWCFWYSN